MRILIVEDDRPVRLMFEHQIQFLGHEVDAFSRGEKAFESIQKDNYQLAILDLMLPGMNGFELCRKIRELPHGNRIMILIITAQKEPKYLQDALDAGADDYLIKPIDLKIFKIRLAVIEKQWQNLIQRLEFEEKLQKSERQLREAYEKVEKLARTDPLTKLSNRRDFLDKAEYERIRFERSGRTFSISICDIDNFKHFNDTYGHDCGDFVLTRMSDIINNTLRKQDIIGRWGGEEFVLLFPETDLEGGQLAAEKVRKKIEEDSYIFKENQFSITMTFGVAQYEKGMNVKECIKNADNALYNGKRSGKNCVVTEKRDRLNDRPSK